MELMLCKSSVEAPPVCNNLPGWGALRTPALFMCETARNEFVEWCVTLCCRSDES
jgi:hypothetical protein